MTYSFTWDGKDAYGRTLQGSQPLTIKVGYDYPIRYSLTSRFGYNGKLLGVAITGTRGASVLTLWGPEGANGKQSVTVGAMDRRPEGMGGWALSAHHTYDPYSRIVYLGHGTRRFARAGVGLPAITEAYAGTGTTGVTPDGRALDVNIGSDPRSLATDGAGNLYFIDSFPYSLKSPRLRRVGLDGMLTTLAGGGTTEDCLPGYDMSDRTHCLQEGAAGTDIVFNADSIYVENNGTIYWASSQRRIQTLVPAPDPRNSGSQILAVKTVAGNAAVGPRVASCDAIKLPSAHFRGKLLGNGGMMGLAGIGTVDCSCTGPKCTSGSRGEVAGTFKFQDEHIPLSGLSPDYVIAGHALSLWVDTSSIEHIKTVGLLNSVDGSVFAGTGAYVDNGDGGPANQAGIHGVHDVIGGRDGSVYILTDDAVRKVNRAGLINTVVGGFGTPIFDGGPATGHHLGFGVSMALGPKDELYVSVGGRIWLVKSPDAGIEFQSSLFVPSEDGAQTYIFDSSGRHLQTVDTMTGKLLLSFSYDSSGRLATVTDASQNVTTIAHDSAVAFSIQPPQMQKTSFTNDANGFLSSMIDPANATSYFVYGADGLLQSYTDARGGQHLFDWYPDGRLKKDTSPGQASKTLARTAITGGFAATVTTAMGRTTTYQVATDNLGQLVRVATDPAGVTTTSVVYGGVLTTTYPNGTKVVQSSAVPDPIYGMAAPLGSTTVSLPDGGPILQASYSRSVTLSNPYDPRTVVTEQDSTTVNGNAWVVSYDSASGTVNERTPEGRDGGVTLDTVGRPTHLQSPGVLPTDVVYDNRGRPSTITQGTRVVTFGYDGQGNLQTITGPEGTSVSLTPDAVGRAKAVTNVAAGLTSSFSYDDGGNVSTVTPPGQPAHSFGYTPDNLESSYTPPDAGTPGPSGTWATTEHYNSDNQLDLQSRPDQATVVPEYDPTSGRLAKVTAGGLVYVPSYDGAGRVSAIAAPGGEGMTYGYIGSLVNNVTWTGPVAGSITRTFNNDFRVSTEQVGNAPAITYGYDKDGLLTSAGAMTILRDPGTGFVSGATLASLSESRTYNEYGEEKTHYVALGNTSLYFVRYDPRDGLGRISTKTETLQGVTHAYRYSYDAAGRLRDVTKDGTPLSHYEYDANGNRMVAPGLTQAPVYDSQDRMLTYGACSYTYKPDGSLQTKTCPDGTTTYDYDAFGNLRNVMLPNGTHVEYVIDGQNRRIGKKVNGILVEGFLYRNQLQPAAWLDGTGAVQATFVYGGKPNVPEYMVKGGTTYRLFTDQVGSVRLVVDPTGNLAERIDYDEFGNVLADSAPGLQPFGFAGGLRDVGTGLTRFGARDYDPVIGRWTAKDRSGFGGGLNFYVYAANSPVEFFDSDGHKVRRHLRRHVRRHVKKPCGTGLGGGNCKWKFKERKRPSSCQPRKGHTFGFDVDLDIDMNIELQGDGSERSADEPKLTIEQHEQNHADDLEFDDSTPDPSEGFDSLKDCQAAAASCTADDYEDFIQRLNDASHRRRDKPR